MRAFAAAILSLIVLALSCSPASAGSTLSGVRFRVIPLVPNDYGDWLDRKMFNGGDTSWRGGVPFYIPHNGGIVKVPNEAGTVDEVTITTTVANARGMFLLGTTTGTLGQGDIVIGDAEYTFSDGTTLTAEIRFPDHYTVYDQDSLPAYPGQPASLFFNADGTLVQYGVSVIFHPFPETKTVTKVAIRNMEDILPDGSNDFEYDAPVWLFGMTAIVQP